MTTYEPEMLGEDDDDGTMVGSKEALEQAIIGRRIVRVEPAVALEYEPYDGAAYKNKGTGTQLVLDDGSKVTLIGQDDCCAFTELEAFLLNPQKIQHAITGVGTTGKYTTWHIFCDYGDIMELKVGWSCGNPFYYGYGFRIVVQP